VVESGKSLLISTGIIREESCRDILIKDQPEEAIIMAISNLYNQGHTKIRIVFDKKYSENDIVNIERFASNLFGVIVEKQDNVLLMTDNSDDKKCTELIVKCFHNILLIAETMDQSLTKDAAWYSQVYESYQRVFFLTEYVFRLIHTDNSSDIKLSLRYFGTVWSLQCLAFLLKRIAENDIELFKANGTVLQFHLEPLFRHVYDVCRKNKPLTDFYKHKLQFDEQSKSMYCNIVVHENIIMYSFLCAKLIKQYSTPVDDPGVNYIQESMTDK